MKGNWRQVELDLTPEQAPVWDAAVSKFILTSKSLREYYDPPITPCINGKATLPFDSDIILELTTLLKETGAEPTISGAICRQLAGLHSREKMF